MPLLSSLGTRNHLRGQLASPNPTRPNRRRKRSDDRQCTMCIIKVQVVNVLLYTWLSQWNHSCFRSGVECICQPPETTRKNEKQHPIRGRARTRSIDSCNCAIAPRTAVETAGCTVLIHITRVNNTQHADRRFGTWKAVSSAG